MSNVRDVKNPGIFAKNAQTTIPINPTPGTSYRDPVEGTDLIEEGWPYEQRVLSQEWNQIEFLRTSLLELLDKTGVLGWSDEVNYDGTHAFVVASDGLIYKKLQNSGPDNGGAKDPTSEPTFWKVVVTTEYVDNLDAQNVKITGNQNVAGVKTHSSFPVTPSSAPTSNYQVSNKKYVDDSVAPNATETVKGRAEIATQSEVNAGTDDTRFVTPKKLKAMPIPSRSYVDHSGGSRVFGVPYTNNTDIEIVVYVIYRLINGTIPGNEVNGFVGGEEIVRTNQVYSVGSYSSITMTVPPGELYVVESVSSNTLHSWKELR